MIHLRPRCIKMLTQVYGITPIKIVMGEFGDSVHPGRNFDVCMPKFSVDAVSLTVLLTKKF